MQVMHTMGGQLSPSQRPLSYCFDRKGVLAVDKSLIGSLCGGEREERGLNKMRGALEKIAYDIFVCVFCKS